MKVKIGKYPHWACKQDLTRRFDDWERREWWNDNVLCYVPSWPWNVWNYFFYKNDRKVSIDIHPHDLYNLDSTLTLIISACLNKFKGTKHGSPSVDNEDVPLKLRATKKQIEKYPTNGWTDPKWHKRWDWVLDEMVWTFNTLNSDWEDKFHNKGEYDKKGHEAENARIQNGLRLFGKYYQALWN